MGLCSYSMQCYSYPYSGQQQLTLSTGVSMKKKSLFSFTRTWPMIFYCPSDQIEYICLKWKHGLGNKRRCHSFTKTAGNTLYGSDLPWASVVVLNTHASTFAWGDWLWAISIISLFRFLKEFFTIIIKIPWRPQCYLYWITKKSKKTKQKQTNKKKRDKLRVMINRIL